MGSGLWNLENNEYHYERPPELPIPGIDRFLADLLPGIRDYYVSHYADESRHYRDPASTGGMAASAVSAVVPETGHLLKHIGTLLEHELDEKTFKLLKRIDFKNYAFIQFLFSWNSIQKDIAAGTPPKVAVGSEALLLTASSLASAGLVYVIGSLGVAAAAPAVVASFVIGASVSFALDQWGFKGWAAKLINDALLNLDTMSVEHPSSVDDASSDHHAPPAGTESGVASQPTVDVPAQPSAPSTDDGLTQFSDYQVYLAMREIIEHPELYPNAAAILPDILSGIADAISPQDLAGVDPVDGDASSRPPPETVRYADLEPDSGVKACVVDDDRSYLFIGDDTPNKMVGGKAINWFMPKTDHGGINTVIGNPDGYNVLDFSLNEKGVDIFIQGNDRVDDRIKALAQLHGVSAGWFEERFLTRDNALKLLRGWFASEELYVDSSARFSEDSYRNIDYIIGSRHDDIIIGDALGGMTITGGAGNDTFVLHGGSNRLVFNDGDFAAPGSGEITTKFIHGLTTGSEADHFNVQRYLPNYPELRDYFGFHLDPDVLDFSNLDGDVNTDGHQAMRFIGELAFTGHAGELRYVTMDSHGTNVPIQEPDDVYYLSTTVRLEGDRTGSGKADFFIEYTNYLNPSNYNELHMAKVIGNIYPFLDDANFFFE
ncbi:hypothetical protein I6I07_10370 [Achromobacter deleyi]|uniref:Calcium-binding protein n=1 Tax=Achromobacter deleyi TaxID=1353891 RepID=A0A7T4B9N0_9BURK|nr:hypothetical protein I6I07_10370 [Achromobacter deleyi]